MKKHQQRFWGLRRYISLLWISLLVFSTFVVKAEVSYPTPESNKYLNDYAGVVKKQETKQIIALGNELEKRTGAQAVVVTIDTLSNMPIEDYANGLFRKWGIGKENEDNGLLILLVVQDKAWRVEVGRGLEGALPDALTNRIMIELAKEDFISGNYGQGLTKVYSQFCDDIAKEYDVTLMHSLQTTLPAGSHNRQKGNFISYLWVIALVVFDVIFNRGRIISFIIQMIFWNNFFGGGRNGRNGGGFGGGSSNGGGSSGSW